MAKVQVQFKDSDLISEIINAKHPYPKNEDEVTLELEKQREDFAQRYFEFGDYGKVEIDTETLAARLLPRNEWKRR